ncbi:MAG: beta-ketoacyl synthase chain length factor [Chitinophagales bacterium]
MLFIHETDCISPQHTFPDTDVETLIESVDNKLYASDLSLQEIPAALLRRMGKAVKMGVGAALSLIKERKLVDGIIIGTSQGGMEDCIRFLNQIIDYEEGLLAPSNFVQSTANAIASQLGLLTNNKCYNMTHVHRGLAFENALLDAAMMVDAHPGKTYLLGGVDEISSYNFHIDFLDGWYKKEPISNRNLYESKSSGSLAGEGAAMFLVNGEKKSAVASVVGVDMTHSIDPAFIRGRLKQFLEKQNLQEQDIDLLISGENGDGRMKKFVDSIEPTLDQFATVCRYKHMSGEYPTASSFAMWLACQILQDHKIPQHMLKKNAAKHEFNRILLYSNCKVVQHSFILLSSV